MATTPIQGGVPSPTLEQPGARRLQPGQAQQGQVSAKAQLNVSIVQASVDVSINAGNEPMQLLLSDIIANLNEVLEPELGKNAIQNAVNQDNTPEGTAERIVSLSTNLLSAFRAQHPGEDDTEVLNNFMATTRKGIDQGFKEAREILQGLGVLQGDIAGNIDRTFELVQQKLDDFQSRMLGTPEEAQA